MKLYKTLFSVFVALFYVNAAFADSPPVPAATPVEDMALRAGYGKAMVEKYLQQPPYDVEQLKKSGQAQDTLSSPLAEEQQAILGNILTTVTNTSSELLLKNVQTTPIPLRLPPKVKASPYASGSPADPLVKAQANSASLDFSTLLAPLQYATTSTGINQQATAEQFIKLATGLANPMQILDLSSLQDADAKSKPKIAAYLAALWTYTAQTATSFGTLYHYYAERIPVSDTALQAKLRDAGELPADAKIPAIQQPASLLKVRQYLATRRIKDTGWYDHMKVADPAEVSREQLFLAAEMRAEIFNLQMEMERTNALLAIMVAQNAANSRMQLEQTRDSLKQSDDLKPPTS